MRCSNCRPGRHALCMSPWCECRVGKHPNRPEKAHEPVAIATAPVPTKARPVRRQKPYPVIPAHRVAANGSAPVVPIPALPQPIGHWRAYGECFRHREDARWSYRSQFSKAEGRQPECAEVDQGVVRCPLDDSCRFSEVPIRGES